MVKKVLASGLTGAEKFTKAEDTAANIQTGSGTLIRVIVGKTGTGLLTIYDAIAGTAAGTIVAEIDTGTLGCYELGVKLVTGLRYAKTGTASVTMVYW